jgi:hypothetical protein
MTMAACVLCAAGALRAHQEGRRGAGGARYIQGEDRLALLTAYTVVALAAAPGPQDIGHGTWYSSRLLNRCRDCVVDPWMYLVLYTSLHAACAERDAAQCDSLYCVGSLLVCGCLCCRAVRARSHRCTVRSGSSTSSASTVRRSTVSAATFQLARPAWAICMLRLLSPGAVCCPAVTLVLSG